MSFIDNALAGRVNLPMVSRVVERVLEMLRRQGTSVAEIAGELQQDPVLSSRVLRLANSSFFAGRRSLASIDDAIGVVGFNSLQTLVVASGAMAAFTDAPTVNLRQFWMASVVTAASARQVARRMGVDVEMAYSAGLLQGIGHLILCQCHPDQAMAAFPAYQVLWGEQLARKEFSAFGVAHPAVSAIWVDQLGMPQEVVEAVRLSLEPVSVAAPRLGRVVQLAASVASAVSAGETVEQATQRIDESLVELLELGDYVAGERFETDFGDLQTLQVTG
jgi:HD-like signal output (HDOD) protein